MGKYYKTIAIPLNTGTKLYSLPTQSGMGGTRILSMIPRKNGRTFNEQLLPNDALFSGIHISIRNTDNIEIIELLPLELITAAFAASGWEHGLAFDHIDWQSSVLTVHNASSIPANTAVELTFEFER
jgi:hypothetical protein